MAYVIYLKETSSAAKVNIFFSSCVIFVFPVNTSDKRRNKLEVFWSTYPLLIRIIETPRMQHLRLDAAAVLI